MPLDSGVWEVLFARGRSATATAQPTKETSEGTTLYSDMPEHGDVPKPKFWQPVVKPRPTYR
eukprot:7505678-Lingulodinium_polyedra.AAC.1